MKLSKNLKLLEVFSFLYNFKLYSGIVAIYFAQVTHSYALGVSIFSVAQISQALFEIPTGIYSDRIGRKTCLILGAIASVLTVLLYAIGKSYAILLVGAVFQGICQALFSGNNDALIYETLDSAGQKDRFHEFYGKIYSSLEFAGMTGIVLGSIIAYKFSFTFLLWISLIPQVLALIVGFSLVEPILHREKIDSIFLHLKEAVLLYKSNFKLRNLSLASVIGIGAGEATWSLQSVFYNSVLPLWLVGPVMSINFLNSAVGYRLSGRILKRVKPLNILIFQEFYSRILDFIALIHPTFVSPFIMASAGAFYGPGEVARNTLLQAEFTDKQRATMASINSFIGNCLFGIFAIFIGSIADHLGVAKALLLAQACLIPVVFIYIKVFKSDKNRHYE